MPSIAFDLETVTPLFLAGADPATAELRPPAFRGALRYWFRAIAGSYYWNNPALLKEIESALLGNTQGSSNITIRLSRIPEQLQLSPVWLDHEQNPGLSYLLFSMKGSGGKNPKPRRQAIGVVKSVQFSLTLGTRPDPRNPEQQKQNLLIAANCFWLAVNLGGFGSRERRGAGSLRVTAIRCQGIAQDEIPKFIINFKASAIPKYLIGELRKAKNNCYDLLSFNRENMPEISQMPNWEIASKYTSKVFLLKKAHEDWREALEHIGKRYKNYRQELERQDRAIFGLPLMNFDMNSRRPSPLRIKIIRSANNYYCLLSQIKASFPEKSKIKNPHDPSYRSINEFISSFSEEEIQRVG
jgi:CRISPR-associated protein Cmr1